MKPRPTLAAALATLLAGTMLIGATQAQALARTDIKRMVIEEAEMSRVPPELAMAVAKVESDFNAKALSTAGARGVMQIMPATGRGVFGVEADELWKARLNVQLGIDYLEQLYKRYGDWELALSHYNGGTLIKGPDGKTKPHAYTRKYVAAVKRWWQRYKDQARVWRAAAKRKDDGWRPARSKVASLATRPTSAAPARRTVVVQSKTTEAPVRRIVVRELPEPSETLPRPRSRPVVTWWSAEWAFEGGFWRRLERARESLDDFSDSRVGRSG
jgi:hypothetical protein